MKLSELKVLVDAYVLREGTWALPDTPAKIKRLIQLMDRPIMATELEKIAAVSSILGSDRLADAMDDASERARRFDKHEEDIRPIILKHLPDFVDTERWKSPPGEQMQFYIKLLRKKFGLKD